MWCGLHVEKNLGKVIPLNICSYVDLCFKSVLSCFAQHQALQHKLPPPLPYFLFQTPNCSSGCICEVLGFRFCLVVGCFVKSTREGACIFVGMCNKYTATARLRVKAVSTVTITHIQERQPECSVGKDLLLQSHRIRAKGGEENKGEVLVQSLTSTGRVQAVKSLQEAWAPSMYIYGCSAAVLPVPPSTSTRSLSSTGSGGLEPPVQGRAPGSAPCPAADRPQCQPKLLCCYLGFPSVVTVFYRHACNWGGWVKL